MDELQSFKPSDLIIIGTLLTFLIADDMDAGDLNVIGNLIVSVGSLLLTWAAQKELLNTSDTESNDASTMKSMNQRIDELQKLCDKLESRLPL